MLYFMLQQLSNLLNMSFSLPPSKLPLVIAKGRFRHLSTLDEDELVNFLRYLIRFTCKEFGVDISQMPIWWTESVIFHPDFARGKIDIPETRNKQIKLRRLVKLCYLHYNCRSLLIMSEQLASQHPLSYKFIREPTGDIAVYRIKTMNVMVRVPFSNMDYVLDPPQNGHTIPKQERVSPTPYRRPVLGSLLGPSRNASNDEAECIVIDSGSETDSDDEVQIISYEPGALPPTPPKMRPTVVYRPGPACSKIRPVPGPFFGPASIQQRLAFGATPRPIFTTYRQPPQPVFQAYRHPPPEPSTPARSKYLQCRPRRNVTIEHVDLTVDDDEEDGVVQPTRPEDLSQGDFLVRMGLGNSADPAAIEKKPVSSPPVVWKNKRLNVRDIPCTMIPHLVSIGYIPRRALCTASEVIRRTEFIDKHTGKVICPHFPKKGRKKLTKRAKDSYFCDSCKEKNDTDTNWFLVTVSTRDKAAVAAAVKKCSIPVKRLNSADLRRWRSR